MRTRRRIRSSGSLWRDSRTWIAAGTRGAGALSVSVDHVAADLPCIRGYKHMSNYQDALTEEIKQQLGCRAHTGSMGRIIGTILGAILAIWLAVTAAGGIFATLKTFLIIGLIAMAVFVVVWLVARRPRRG